MPHYITVRIENGHNPEELTEEELGDLCDTIRTFLQDVNNITGLSGSEKVGNSVGIYKAESYGGPPDSEL